METGIPYRIFGMNKFLALISLAVFASQVAAQQAVWGQCQLPMQSMRFC
jgi:hypothetical protein